jgi:hypothetical protein
MPERRVTGLTVFVDRLMASYLSLILEFPSEMSRLMAIVLATTNIFPENNA